MTEFGFQVDNFVIIARISVAGCFKNMGFIVFG